MRQLLILLLLSFPVIIYGQKNKLQFSFQIQPEMTFHKASYAWWKENSSKITTNLGIVTAVQYNSNQKFFVNVGLGFISRKLQTANILNQAALPPPKQSFTLELVTTKSVSYRTLLLPVSFGYNFIRQNKINTFVTVGFTGNYLLNTYYNSNHSKYDGAYKKNYWQGISLNLGVGIDYKIANKIFATTSFSYAPINTVRRDDYIQNHNGNGLALTHNYLNLNMGLKIPM